MTTEVHVSDEKSTGIAVTVDRRGLVNAMSGLVNRDGGTYEYLTSLVATDLDGVRRIMRCKSEADFSAEDLIQSPFAAVDWFAHRVEVSGDNGELIPLLRVVFVGPDNSTAAFTSAGVADGLGMLIQLLGPGPWSPPVGLKIRPVKTRKGRTTYALEIV